jgi:hypothetical protein
MPNHETEIQNAIIGAIELFFTSPEFGYGVKEDKITVVIPASGGQARTVDDFGRKPYDFAFHADKTIVLFFEVKERKASGKLSEFNGTQHDMLQTLVSNGVDIRYVYNGWDFDRSNRLMRREVLEKAHVRKAKDMTNPIEIKPLPPAVTLRDHLFQATRGGRQKLVDILDSDISQIDYLNSMPLMILANLDGSNQQILMDRSPVKSLKMMKDFFNLPADERDDALSRISMLPNGSALQSLAKSIFGMRDYWHGSSQKKIRP